MKQCPTCNRTYHDDTQSFCLEDGAPLVTEYDRDATHIFIPPPARPILSSKTNTRLASTVRNTSPALLITITLLALLVGGTFVTLLKSRSSPSSQGAWFVVLGSFPRNSYAKAAQRLQAIQTSGPSANIIDTDRYPGFTPGMWAVVMGPYSEADAKEMARQMNPVYPDAYPKQGS